MDVTFRKATISDVENIISLCNECFFEKTSLDYALDTFKKTMNDPNQIYIIGEFENNVIAHAKITIIPTIYEPMSTYSILNHVCVKPEYRRHNIASKMLEEIEKICIENKCKKMELWSNNVRTAAHACYKKFGFTIDDAGFFSKEI